MGIHPQAWSSGAKDAALNHNRAAKQKAADDAAYKVRLPPPICRWPPRTSLGSAPNHPEPAASSRIRSNFARMWVGRRTGGAGIMQPHQ